MKAARYASDLRGSEKSAAHILGVPISALALVPGLGVYDHYHGEHLEASDGGRWGWSVTFPERDEDCEIIGIYARECIPGIFRARYEPIKVRMSGGLAGLVMPVRCLSSTGPLYLPEGGTDVLAMSAAGLACVGRPSNRGGVELLSRLICKYVPVDRAVYWLGENDRNPVTGEWPGDTRKAAQQVADAANRPILYVFPPHGSKDVRAWLTHPDHAGAPWADRGQELAEWLKRRAETITPGSGPPPFVISDVPSSPADKPPGVSATSLIADKSNQTTSGQPPTRPLCRWGARHVLRGGKTGGSRIVMRLSCGRWTCTVCGPWKRDERACTLGGVIASAPAEQVRVYTGDRAGLKRIIGAISRAARRHKPSRLSWCSVQPDLDTDAVYAVVITPLADDRLTASTPAVAATGFRAAVDRIRTGPDAPDRDTKGRHFAYSRGFAPRAREPSSGEWECLGIPAHPAPVISEVYRRAGMKIKHIAEDPEAGTDPGAVLHEIRACGADRLPKDVVDLMDAKVLGDAELDAPESDAYRLVPVVPPKPAPKGSESDKDRAASPRPPSDAPPITPVPAPHPRPPVRPAPSPPEPKADETPPAAPGSVIDAPTAPVPLHSLERSPDPGLAALIASTRALAARFGGSWRDYVERAIEGGSRADLESMRAALDRYRPPDITAAW
jgi:hypothetical protein